MESVIPRHRRQAITEATHRLNQLVVMSFVDLGSKLFHKDIKGIVLHGFFITPDCIDKGLTTQHRLLMTHHELQKQKFSPRQTDGSTRARGRVGARVELQIGHLILEGHDCWLATAKSSETCKELGKGERLGQVVIDAGVQPFDDVGGCVTCRQHEDGSRHLGLPQSVSDITRPFQEASRQGQSLRTGGFEQPPALQYR